MKNFAAILNMLLIAGLPAAWFCTSYCVRIHSLRLNSGIASAENIFPIERFRKDQGPIQNVLTSKSKLTL